jgi:beta-1,4-N-acetylglucosaminyltransferase
MVVSSLDRVCLVTVGATTGFKTLIDSVLSPNFWQYIASQGFTELHVQCGPDVISASKQLTFLKDELPSGLTIDIFDVKKNLMKEEMILCRDLEGKRQLGLVISHAGMYNDTLLGPLFTQYRYWYNTGCLENGIADCCGAKYATPERSPD